MIRTNQRGASPSAEDVERAAYRERIDAFVASRDAGHSLTRDALRTGITLTTVVDVVGELHNYAEEAQAIVVDEYRPRIDCREACSFCCCKPGVRVLVPELIRILEHVRTHFDEPARNALRDSARRYAMQVEERDVDEPTNESVPCPLLVDSRCSVYDVRPLVCRGYNSTSVEACRRAHGDSSQLVPIFAMLKDVTDGTTVGASQALEAARCNHAMIDLGSALNIVLAADTDLMSVVEGEDQLRSIEDKAWAATLWSQVRNTSYSLLR